MSAVASRVINAGKAMGRRSWLCHLASGHRYVSTFKLAISRAMLAAWIMLAAVAEIADAGPLEDAATAHERGDDATAVRLLRALAEEGNAFAQFALGFIYDTSKGIPQDDAEAAKWYRKAADQGVAGAQSNLGAMYADAMACRAIMSKRTSG